MCLPFSVSFRMSRCWTDLSVEELEPGAARGCQSAGTHASLRHADKEPSGEGVAPLWKTHVPVRDQDEARAKPMRKRSRIPGFIYRKDLQQLLFAANNKQLTICSRWGSSIDFHPPICKITTNWKLKLPTLTLRRRPNPPLSHRG